MVIEFICQTIAALVHHHAEDGQHRHKHGIDELHVGHVLHQIGADNGINQVLAEAAQTKAELGAPCQSSLRDPINPCVEGLFFERSLCPYFTTILRKIQSIFTKDSPENVVLFFVQLLLKLRIFE